MNSGRRICILLPGPIYHPAGGYRIALLYAEELKAKGWDVRVVIPHLKRSPLNFLEALKVRYWTLRSHFRNPLKWFEFSRISPEYVAYFRGLCQQEILVAVGADSMEAAIAGRAERKTIHFIQGYEDWSHEERVLRTLYSSAAQRVVISKGLWKRLDQQGLESIIIPNPVERNYFNLEIPYLDREELSVGFMVHEQPLKAWRVAWSAVQQLQIKYPQMQVRSFGTGPRPVEFPETVEYIQSPNRNTLKNFYNSIRLFLAPSLSEGWGLTPAEAMQCGCCVVASDIEGHREFMVHELNGLLAKPGDAEELFQAVDAIVKDPERGRILASRAVQSLEKFSMESSIGKWEEILIEFSSSTSQA